MHLPMLDATNFELERFVRDGHVVMFAVPAFAK